MKWSAKWEKISGKVREKMFRTKVGTLSMPFGSSQYTCGWHITGCVGSGSVLVRLSAATGLVILYVTLQLGSSVLEPNLDLK